MLFSDIDTAVCSGGALLQFVGLSVSIVIDYTFIQGRQEFGERDFFFRKW